MLHPEVPRTDTLKKERSDFKPVLEKLAQPCRSDPSGERNKLGEGTENIELSVICNSLINNEEQGE